MVREIPGQVPFGIAETRSLTNRGTLQNLHLRHGTFTPPPRSSNHSRNIPSPPPPPSAALIVERMKEPLENFPGVREMAWMWVVKKYSDFENWSSGLKLWIFFSARKYQQVAGVEEQISGTISLILHVFLTRRFVLFCFFFLACLPEIPLLTPLMNSSCLFSVFCSEPAVLESRTVYLISKHNYVVIGQGF